MAPEIVVLRAGTEGLPMAEYCRELESRLPAWEVRHARTPHMEREFVRSASVVTGIDIDEKLLERAESLQLFAAASAGTDHLPMGQLQNRGVAVTNAAGIHVPGIAEQAIGYLLVFTRRLDEGWRRGQRAEWRHFKATELGGSTVTILGMGSIGRAIAERLAAFDVTIIGARYTPSKGGPADEIIGFDGADLHEALSRSEYVVVACPLTDTTRHLLDEAAFDTLPPDAVLVNVARGGIVDTDALVGALRDNQLRGAGLDVTDPEPLPPEHPLWTFENVLITPHTGGHNPDHWPRLADIVATNVERMRETGSTAGLENLIYSPD